MTIDEIRSESMSKIYSIILIGLLFLTIGLSVNSIDEERKSYMPYVYGAMSSLLLISMVGVGHNFVHHKENIFKYAFIVAGFTHNEWQIMHCLSHHMYPNMELDF